MNWIRAKRVEERLNEKIQNLRDLRAHNIKEMRRYSRSPYYSKHTMCRDMEYFHRGRETAFDLSIEIIEMIKSSIDREVVNANTLGAP